MRADHAVIHIAKAQRGVFSRKQAHDAGLTDHRLRTRVAAGVFERQGPNAFRLPGSDTDPLSRLVGMMIDVGDPCWAAGPTAAALYRIDGFAISEPFHVVIPRDRNVRRIGSVIHTSGYLPPTDFGEIDGIAVMKPTRTLIDLARMVDRSTLTVAVDSAIRDRLTSEDALHRRIARLDETARRHLAVGALVDVLAGSEIERGGHSVLEREFLKLVAASGLPRPLCQQVLGRAGESMIRVDFRFPDTNVVVEVLGYRYHRTPAQLNRDAERLNLLISDGFRPFQFSFDHVVNQPATVVATLRQALAQAA